MLIGGNNRVGIGCINKECTVRPASSLRNTSFGRSTATGSIDPISGLHAVLQEGYVVQVGTDEFKWSHDRITQAATELIKPKSRQKIHFKIAQHLMQGKKIVYPHNWTCD